MLSKAFVPWNQSETDHMKTSALLCFSAMFLLAACGSTSSGGGSSAPNTVTGDDYFAPEINRMIAAGTSRADAETTMLRHRLQDDARAYVTSNRLPAGSGWTKENLMFKRVKDEAGLRAILADFYGYPANYADVFKKMNRYPAATFCGLVDDTYCVLYFDQAGTLVDGAVF